VALVSSVSSTCRWLGRISGARSDSRRQRRRNERSTFARLSSGDELIYPIRTGSKCRGSNPKGRSKSGAVGTWQTATLETEFCGQRLSTTRAANESRRRSKRPSRPTAAAASRGNVALFCGPGNHVDLRGLLGGAVGIRTPDLRSASARAPLARSGTRPALLHLGADGFAGDASLIAADANKQRSVPSKDWKPEEIKEPRPEPLHVLAPTPPHGSHRITTAGARTSAKMIAPPRPSLARLDEHDQDVGSNAHCRFEWAV
jgi:hypothetical protein